MDAADGALVSALGIFDQGYYNRLGYGNGAYEHIVAFDPATLAVEVKPRPPRRLSLDDAELMHASRLTRKRVHGSCNLEPVQLTRAELYWAPKGFGLGYADGPHGKITHHLWCEPKEVETGPYDVRWMSYRNRHQFLELMALLREFLKKELNELVGSDIRLSVIGRMDDLEPAVRRDVEKALAATASNSGMELCIALSYGGRTEIVDACRSLMRSGLKPDDLDPQLFAEHLYTAGRPDPDLLIRTSGELRVSNFLLWQIAYAEIWVTDTLWPDFRRRQLFEALLEFQRRERRYGGLTDAG